VLANLLDNDRHHAFHKETVKITGCREGYDVIVEEKDDGFGESAGNTDRIFDRFFTTARDHGGTGLGLAIAQQRLRAFGGDLVLVPSEQGAAFHIHLKAAA
jgi:signal transduction histidine kinase